MAQKVWPKIRAKASGEWSASLSAYWDTAVAGYSALRASLILAVMDEGAHGLSFGHATVFLDLTKFDDTVSFVLLMQAGLNIGFPPSIILLETGLHYAPQLLEKGQMIPDAIDVTRSVVAGSGHGVPSWPR
eukprot:1394087-Pyramimonas_sp.AAC.1